MTDLWRQELLLLPFHSKHLLKCQTLEEWIVYLVKDGEKKSRKEERREEKASKTNFQTTSRMCKNNTAFVF